MNTKYQKALDYLWKVSDLLRKSTHEDTVKSLRLLQELINKVDKYQELEEKTKPKMIVYKGKTLIENILKEYKDEV